MTNQIEQAAGYVRMSSDKQDASPERQRAELTKLAEQHGCKIARWYEDLGMTGTESTKREDFQRLLRDCEKRKWRTVFYYEPSRLSREHPLDSLAHLNTFRKAGVRMISTVRGLLNLDDVGGQVMSLIDAHASHDESIKIATRSVSGKRAKYQRGERAHGGALFGFDRELVDESGQVVKRVHFRERFRKPLQWRHRLVASADVEAVQAVRDAFRRVLDGDKVVDIARDFAERGLTTIYGKPFSHEGITDLLRNPAYCGTMVAGRECRGKFRRLDQEGIIWHENAHDKIVSKELFDAVQEELAYRQRPQRARERGRYLLGNTVRCDHCGGRMYGRREPKGLYYASPELQHTASCPKIAIRAERLEAAVLSIIKEHAYTPGNRAAMARERAMLAAKGGPEPSHAAAQLAAIEKKIEVGQANLFLCEIDEDRRALTAMLAKCREQADKLKRELQIDEQYEAQVGEVGDAMQFLGSNVDRLDLCERHELSRAIVAIIERVVVGEEWVGEGRGRHRRLYALVEFMDAYWDGEPIKIEDRDLAPATGRRFYEICDYIKEQGRPVLHTELTKHFGISDGAMVRHTAKGVAAGLLEKVGTRGGWRAAG